MKQMKTGLGWGNALTTRMEDRSATNYYLTSSVETKLPPVSIPFCPHQKLRTSLLAHLLPFHESILLQLAIAQPSVSTRYSETEAAAFVSVKARASETALI